ncbi:MAG TPA: bifunctional class I SAM-dependent methyltransferase/HIT family protein [Anaerolineae bacterium]|nr:MAG: AP-4-A phosphorylase [Chloroflexi bacterium ADurb.Bin222]HOC20141.1 bifunctional class I SAM-dependent methyltransferase/HIT family protein [Anaerolineae bacterium]HQM13185.1 bifunctional class I SAM-dependent methyltransferase/HIT family protein [Anaerolineae bacterium]
MNLIYRSPQNPNSHLTVKERTQASFPVKYLLNQGLLRGRILDFGCGLGVDVAFLQARGFEAIGYDPHYAPDPPQGKFDTILCLYVLNVLLPEEQAHVLMAIAELLKPEGQAYFAVRRDIQRDGFRTHVKHNVSVYQCNVRLPYRSLLCTESAEIYEYRHYNQLPHSNPGACPFCAPDAERELLTESATTYAIFDKFPVSPGHTLIIPKKHVADYFDLSTHTKTACWLIADRVKMLLTERLHPDGFNVGFNIGLAAGQTIPHVHIHVIPRYAGDVENPTGGVRHVIAGKGDYLYDGGH